MQYVNLGRTGLKVSRICLGTMTYGSSQWRKWVLDEEERFLTPEVLTASNMIGTRDQIIEQLHGMAEAGLNQVMILPNFDTRYDVLEEVAREILPNV